MKENEVGGSNPHAKMGSWFIPWPSLGGLSGALTGMSDKLW